MYVRKLRQGNCAAPLYNTSGGCRALPCTPENPSMPVGRLILHCTAGLINHRVFQYPELVNRNPHDIAGLEPDFRIHP